MSSLCQPSVQSMPTQDPSWHNSKLGDWLSDAARACLTEEFHCAKEEALQDLSINPSFLTHELQLIRACRLQNKTWGKPNQPVYKYHVFLGGACNPTTWRKDIAIPMLEDHNITYYNPQVEEWSEEIVKIEAEAKSTSVVFLCVFETWRTRAVSSFVEAAALAGRNAKLVFVVSNTSGSDPPSICNERISDTEYTELKDALRYLHDIARIRGIPVFTDLKEGLYHVIEIIKQHRLREDRRARLAHLLSDDVSLLDRIESVCRVFRSLHKCEPHRVTLEEARIGLQRLGLDLPCNPSNWTHSNTLNFQQFCQAYTTYVLEHCKDRCSSDSHLLTDYGSCDFNLDLYLGSSELSKHTDVDPNLRLLIDSYRKTFPSLRTNLEMNAVNRSCDNQPDENLRFCPWTRAHSRLLLYFVDSNSFNLRTMMEASFAIGSGQKAVLCVESIGNRVHLSMQANLRSPEKDTQTPVAHIVPLGKRKPTGLVLPLPRHNVLPSLPTSPLSDVQSVPDNSHFLRDTKSDSSDCHTWSTASSPMTKSIHSLQRTPDSGVSSNLSQSSSPNPTLQPILDSLESSTLNPCSATDAPKIPSQTMPTVLPISTSAVNDYNRGRRYLQSVCEDYHIPITKNLREAITKCFSLLHLDPASPSSEHCLYM